MREKSCSKGTRGITRWLEPSASGAATTAALSNLDYQIQLPWPMGIGCLQGLRRYATSSTECLVDCRTVSHGFLGSCLLAHLPFLELAVSFMRIDFSEFLARVIYV